MCVSGSDKDGHPAERSDRVRAVAAEALARCPLVQEIIENGVEKNGDIKKTQFTPKVDPTEFYERVEKMSREEVAASARAVLAKAKQGNQAVPAGTGPAIPPIHQRPGNLSGILTNAFGPENVAKAPATVRTPPTQISLYEYLTTRNPSPESVNSARSEVVGPSRGLTFPRSIYSQPVAQAQFGAPSTGGVSVNTGPRETTGYIAFENLPNPQSPPLPTHP